MTPPSSSKTESGGGTSRKYGVEKANRLHDDLMRAWGHKQKNPYNSNPTKVKLWSAINSVMKTYRADPNKSVSSLVSKLNTGGTSAGGSQFEMFFGKPESDASPEEFVDKGNGVGGNDFAEFGKEVVAHRAAVEVKAKKLVAFMMWGEGVIDKNGKVDISNRDIMKSPSIDKKNEFIKELTSYTYKNQVATIAELTNGLGQTTVGKFFLASQFANRDWENNEDTSNVVFDPYKLFYPPEVSTDKSSMGAQSSVVPDLHLGIGIAKKGENIPSREDLFSDKGQLKPPSESGYRSQSKTLLSKFTTLLSTLSPGVHYLHEQSISGSATISVTESLALQNIDNFMSLSWGKFQSHDLKKHLGLEASHTDHVGKVAKAQPPKKTDEEIAKYVVDKAAQFANLNDKLMVDSAEYSSFNFASEADRLPYFGIVKVIIVGYGMYWNVASAEGKLSGQGTAGQKALAATELGMSLAGYINDMEAVEDIAHNFDSVNLNSMDDAGKLFSAYAGSGKYSAKLVSAAGKVAPVVDLYGIAKTAFESGLEYEEGDCWAAGGKAAAAGGMAMMSAGTAMSAAVLGLSPAGWIIAGGVLLIGGTAVAWGLDDTKLQNYLEQTCFGADWKPGSLNKYHEDPSDIKYRFIDANGKTNYARQIAALKTLGTDLNPTATLYAHVNWDSSGSSNAMEVLKLLLNPNPNYAGSLKKTNDVRPSGVLYVRPLAPPQGKDTIWEDYDESGKVSNTAYRFLPVYHKIKLGEMFEYDPDKQVVERTNGLMANSETEIPNSAINTVYKRVRNASTKGQRSGAVKMKIEDMDYETTNDLYGYQSQQGDHLTKVIKEHKTVIKADYNEDQQNLYPAGEPLDEIHKKELIIDYFENGFYLELTYVPEGTYKDIGEAGILDLNAGHNQYDMLENMPSVLRWKVKVQPEFGISVDNWYDIID